MKTANLFWIVLLVLSLSLTSYLLACNDDDDDDAASDDDASDDDNIVDDDNNDDDSSDDDNVDDDTVNDSDALAYSRHEVDVFCNDFFERGQDILCILQSAICVDPTGDEPEIQRIYPYILIVVYYYDNYSWLGIHESLEYTGQCYYGFYAEYYQAENEVFPSIAGQVEIVAEGEDYQAIYSIEFENGYEFEGSLLLDLCGNPPVGE